MLDGRHLGVAVGIEPDRAPTCAAGDVVAGQVDVELSGENRGFGDGTSRDDVVGWWTRTTVLCKSCSGHSKTRWRPAARAN